MLINIHDTMISKAKELSRDSKPLISLDICFSACLFYNDALFVQLGEDTPECIPVREDTKSVYLTALYWLNDSSVLDSQELTLYLISTFYDDEENEKILLHMKSLTFKEFKELDKRTEDEVQILIEGMIACNKETYIYEDSEHPDQEDSEHPDQCYCPGWKVIEMLKQKYEIKGPVYYVILNSTQDFKKNRKIAEIKVNERMVRFYR